MWELSFVLRSFSCLCFCYYFQDHVWIAKPFIQAPHYDNHFDIQSDQYKLGKCLYLLGRVQGDDLLGRSLQLTGLALYNKFPKAISLLQRWQETGKKDLVMSEAVRNIKSSCEVITECSDILLYT